MNEDVLDYHLPAIESIELGPAPAKSQLSLPGCHVPLLTPTQIQQHVRSMVEGYEFRQAERVRRREAQYARNRRRREFLPPPELI